MGFDLKDVFAYVRNVHTHTGTLVDSVAQFSPVQYTSCGLASEVCFVEPSHQARSSPDPGPSMDSLTRLVLFTAYEGTMDATKLHVVPQYSRNAGGDFVAIGPATGYLVAALTTNRSHMHIIENPLPFDFMSILAEAVDIDDELFMRVKILPTANSTGDVTTTVVSLLVPGPINAGQGKPRGSAFSLPGMDY